MRQMTVQEADAFLKKHKQEMTRESATKLTHAVRAGKEGVERVHIIDGREQEGCSARCSRTRASARW
ncbi:MAG: hypothetical protein U0792_13980 [Gemmataceae bacterium]